MDQTAGPAVRRVLSRIAAEQQDRSPGPWNQIDCSEFYRLATTALKCPGYRRSMHIRMEIAKSPRITCTGTGIEAASVEIATAFNALPIRQLK